MLNEKKNKNKVLQSFNLCLVFLFVLGGFYFLKNMDDLIVKNVELEHLKVELNLLKEERAEMESIKNSLESYESVDERIRDLNLVKVTNIDYISVGDDILAKK